MLVYPRHLQVLTPRRVRDTLVYSAQGEVPDETSFPGAGGLFQSTNPNPNPNPNRSTVERQNPNPTGTHGSV